MWLGSSSSLDGSKLREGGIQNIYVKGIHTKTQPNQKTQTPVWLTGFI